MGLTGLSIFFVVGMFCCVFLLVAMQRMDDRIKQLIIAIKLHRAATRYDPCWENDVELWQVLGDDDYDWPHARYDSPQAMLAGCRKYVEGHCKPDGSPKCT